MTITIQHNAGSLLRNDAASISVIDTCRNPEDSLSYDLRLSTFSAVFDFKLLQSQFAQDIPLRSNDDYTSTSPSLSDDSSIESYMKKLRFADPLVTEVRTRPRTPREDISGLFYSSEQISQFREDYYESIESDRETYESEECQGYNPEDSTLIGTSCSMRQLQCSKRLVSKVSIDYQGKHMHLMEKQADDDHLFDNPAFWNGSITWWY
mmetsp:Transcript_1500/g.1915  ORF Transcript_1500/g.1915 Transcript_1500/m.1915 type:complete len:208 (+) Transcript_1500:38-661(+)|eukprot:CAMPEP_0172494574 /NCGR_PEP_ID=MMETSP1066-20121228/51226_1 /TAXON_ID=671091 /ORGANISM="Coscinodiscus wailesii, Strain CCMP2513" /LENGTH=207 /DNA_ID=CAMNT_0013265651 /DNA_START=38 /DNA_END=661 /DNA_ORIENTATION=+